MIVYRLVLFCWSAIVLYVNSLWCYPADIIKPFFTNIIKSKLDVGLFDGCFFVWQKWKERWKTWSETFVFLKTSYNTQLLTKSSFKVRCLLRVMSIIRRFSSIMDSYNILSFWFDASLCLYCCYFSINIVPLPLKEVNYVNEEI